MTVLDKVNLLGAANAVRGLYQYDKVGRLNGHVLSVVQVENRTLDFHTHEQSDDASFHLGPYEFRPSAKVLIDEAQRKIRLTDKETDILRYLYKAGGKPVPREELMAEVWGHNSQATTHTLETHMYRLRQKIEPNPGLSRFLITEGGGYSLQP